MNKTEQINRKLYEKMSKEYDSFYEMLRNLPPEKIIESSYEKVFKEDILLCFERGNLEHEKAKALYSFEQPLSSLYDEWINTNYSYMDMLRDVIDIKAESAKKEIKRVSKVKER